MITMIKCGFTGLTGPSMAQAELNLVEAARQAGTIKLFIPSQFGGEYPVKGPYKHLYTPPLKAIVSGKDVSNQLLSDVVVCSCTLPWRKFTFNVAIAIASDGLTCTGR
jgi:hypothetical protein